ncbi:ClbS/DfsB family four-helix bundle protein [Aminipila butyrica]|uniref:ClbS/DfsB family four-helix bundle protein n=1 Tax=Aminipila butyrica TaxID=433296 RepID=A0A858BTL3_9FIRM|nr:ClbS/DfsB family four-helix bundle protein [Aminipila butyrica]QIB68897.1 ClbS/DfsB family four-helix bundle protein [Aminipila butyrica]
MQEYANREALIAEIKKTANLFISEFDGIHESDKAVRFEEVDRTPQEIIAYQLGWMKLLRSWDKDELAGKEVVTPSPGYKWNQLGGLYQSFYAQYQEESLSELIELFGSTVEELIHWLDGFSDEELFCSGGRKWASSTPSNWPIWKWVHINTVAPFKSFRSKIRKWKKLRTKAICDIQNTM